MALGEFHHFGVPTKSKSNGESYLEGAKLYLTDPTSHPFRVEFLRFMEDSPMPELLRTWPHAAFVVPDMDAALAGKNVLIQPFDATDEFRCAFVVDGDALIEVMVRRK